MVVLMTSVSGAATASDKRSTAIGSVEVMENKCQERCKRYTTTTSQMQCMAACKGK
jgi:hypothetical protein